MSFSKAFKYPFRNLARVLMITLAFAMIIAVLFALMLNSLSNTSLLILVGIISIAQVLFISGYGLRITRAISDGDENIPPFEGCMILVKASE